MSSWMELGLLAQSGVLGFVLGRVPTNDPRLMKALCRTRRGRAHHRSSGADSSANNLSSSASSTARSVSCSLNSSTDPAELVLDFAAEASPAEEDLRSNEPGVEPAAESDDEVAAAACSAGGGRREASARQAKWCSPCSSSDSELTPGWMSDGTGEGTDRVVAWIKTSTGGRTERCESLAGALVREPHGEHCKNTAAASESHASHAD